MILYRYETRDIKTLSGHIMSLDVVSDQYHVIKETQKGYWVSIYKSATDIRVCRFVLKSGKKRFAHESKEQALQAFIKRKERQVNILKAQLSIASLSILEAEKIKQDQQ